MTFLEARVMIIEGGLTMVGGIGQEGSFGCGGFEESVSSSGYLRITVDHGHTHARWRAAAVVTASPRWYGVYVLT